MFRGMPSYFGVGPKRIRGVGHRDLAGLEHVGLLGDAQREVRVLLHQQDRHAFLVDLLDRLVDALGEHGRDPIEGSLSSSTLRLPDVGAPHGQHLLLAAGHRARLLRLTFLQAREELEDRRCPCSSGRCPGAGRRRASRFSWTVMRWKHLRPRGLAVPNPTISCGGASRSPPREFHEPVRGRRETGDRPPGGVLPGPVGADQRTHSPSSTVNEMPLSASMLLP